MTRRLAAIDRTVTALVGLALIAGGVALLDWRYRWFGTWSDSVSTARLDDVESSAWWPWVFALGGVVLGLVGLLWLLSHAPRPGEKAVRLPDASDRAGSVHVDLSGVAKAVAADFEARTNVTHVKGTARRQGRTHVIELRGQLDPHVTGGDIESAASRCTHDVSDAFPDGHTVCRVLLGHDHRRSGRTRASAHRVR
ncbi:hypothetical protein [Aeromicrobium sp. Root472D3]|uniref:hypothetical protein n=1 Tax=Aeromicrobium sp. Root472D3 TaxID=1736540 RepID=UPI0006F343B1|nr:hypothetical protein [Aeromicrobium sp. Root472D3]KQX73726.1 hypothetical protein ASD10_00125 [Aeromicrobium sp. Root472D3]